MNLRIPVTLTSVILLAACQSSVIEPLKPEEILTPDAESEVYQPILLTRTELDSLSELSQDMITDHNNVYWCRNPATRPRGFDKSICDTD